MECSGLVFLWVTESIPPRTEWLADVIDQMVGGGGWLGCSDDTQKEITSLWNGLHRFDAFQLLMPSEGAGKLLGVSYGPPFISNLKSMYIVNWGLRWVRAFFRWRKTWERWLWISSVLFSAVEWVGVVEITLLMIYTQVFLNSGKPNLQLWIGGEMMNL